MRDKTMKNIIDILEDVGPLQDREHIDWSRVDVECDAEYGDGCGWKGTADQCGQKMESEGWEYPEYPVATCPKCENEIEW